MGFLTGAPQNFLSTNLLQSLALREILSYFTWNLVLRKIRGAPVEKKTPCINIITATLTTVIITFVTITTVTVRTVTIITLIIKITITVLQEK